MNDETESLLDAIRASIRLASHREMIESLDPDSDPIERITGAFREERDLLDAVGLAISGRLDDLAEQAEEVAAGAYEQAVQHLHEAYSLLGVLRAIAYAVEGWSEASQRETRVDFGADLVEAARADLRKVIVPLPVIEFTERGSR